MAQSGFTPISIYYSSTASAVPTAANLVPGELAINTNDGKLYYEDSSGVVRVLASKSTGSIGGSTTQIQYNNAGSLAGSANFVFDGTNVGIGVTPSAQFSGIKSLQIGSTTNLFDNTTSTKFYHNAYTATSGNETYLTTGYAQGYLMTSNGQHQWYIAASGTAGNTFSFTQAMTLDASGNLLVGTTSLLGSAKVGFLQSSSGQVLTMQNSNAAPYGIACLYTGASPNSTISQYLYCDDTGGLRMEVRSNGGIANYTANNVILSDRREKTNFTPATPYLDKICAIPVQTFNYIDQNLEEDGGLTLGVVAQDVQAVAPELVSEGNWGTKENPKMRLEIYQTDLQYALMKALQELKAEFDAYKVTHP
jgi:hypothetical protein